MNGTTDTDSVIANAGETYPALTQLFGAFFHQDWREEHETPAQAARAFRRDAPSDGVRDAIIELDRLLDVGLDESSLARVLSEGFDCNYVPESDGIPASRWLGELRDALSASG